MARQPSPSSPAPVGAPLTRFQGLTATAIAESTSAYVVSEISNSLPKSGSNLIGHCPEDRILVFSYIEYTSTTPLPLSSLKISCEMSFLVSLEDGVGRSW